MAAAAGIVVTEMNTPMRALARACRIETTPTMPAMNATTTEYRLGWLIRSETGRNPSRKSRGAWPVHRMIHEKIRVATTAMPNPMPRATSPRFTGRAFCSVIPRAVPSMALYSGPTTMAATIRICELVRMPTAAMRPAAISSMKKLKG